MEYMSLFRKVKDYPIKGIMFEDVTPYWKNPDAFSYSIKKISEHFCGKNISKVIGIEARGFVVAAPIAFVLGAGFVPVRKPNKLPVETLSCSYSSEYSDNTLEIHADAISPEDNVLICDDLLATGGTLHASEQLVIKMGGNLTGIAVLSELIFLAAREKLLTKDIFSLYQVSQE